MDPLFPTQPIQALGSTFFKKKQWSAEEKTDTKVKGFALEKIGDGPRGALLPSATAPHVILDLLSALAFPAPLPISRRKKQPRLRKIYRRTAPIGLRSCRPYEWMNAWVQFLLYLPSIPDLFPFLPRSFDSFREFLDQYMFDQMEGRSISSANSAALIRCLSRTIPALAHASLYELFCLFTQTAFPKVFSNAILFHPEWHLVLNDQENAFQKKVKQCPPEILVAIEGGEYRPVLKKQVSNGCYYDLDAFIERRPDGLHAPSFIAYIKVEGTWYQCDNDRVTPLLSTTLGVPLRGGILFHYKKITF